MKKNILLAAIALLFSVVAVAGPAYPGRIVYTQPDGTTIGIYLHGDEFYHWMTDDNGNTVVDDGNGFIVPARGDALTSLMKKKQEASVQRSNNRKILKAATSTSNNFGSPEIPVLLIGFSGSNNKITKSQEQFDAMLNTPGYSDNNAIGSVYDYYNENSFGQFTPHFDVLSTVNLSGSVSTYGSNDGNAYKALLEACEQLDSTVDFSKYDNDGDGTIDFIIFYFGGYDEAQCPQTSTYTKYIWSHASDISSLNQTFDGKKVGKYFCTSELKGYSGSTMCSIGTTCHEFAHTLGLPDFYDVRYQNGDSNTQSANMYSFDLMASGSYNGDSTTPPYLNAEELMEIGWLSSIPDITTTGSYSLQAINYLNATNYSAYKTKTSVNNEYFVYETRGGTRWDAYLPTGLLVYHVDKSTNKITSSITASSVWSKNYVNSYADHPCCYVVPASNPTQTDLYSGTARNMVFGTTYKSFTPTAWSGQDTGFQLSGITYSNGTVTFNVSNSNALGIDGIITDSSGNPLAGATVSIVTGSMSSLLIKDKTGRFEAAPKKAVFSSRSAARAKASTLSVTTDENGRYSITVDNAGTYDVTAAKDGYVSQTISVNVTSVIETVNFVLLREGESLPSELATFPEDADFGNYGNSSYDSWDLLVSNIYPVSYIGAYAGKQIKTISFMPGGTAIDNCTVVVDYGDTRALALPIEEPLLDDWFTVDVTDQELIIPNGTDVFVGYGGNISGNYPIWATTTEDSELIGYMADFDVNDLQTVAWEAWDGFVFAIKITVGDYNPSDTGYNYIDDPQNGNYSAGDVLPLTLVLTEGDRKPAGVVKWFFDDEPVSGTSVTLPSGNHVVMATFTTAAGTKKVVELELTVN